MMASSSPDSNDVMDQDTLMLNVPPSDTNNDHLTSNDETNDNDFLLSTAQTLTNASFTIAQASSRFGIGIAKSIIDSTSAENVPLPVRAAGKVASGTLHVAAEITSASISLAHFWTSVGLHTARGSLGSIEGLVEKRGLKLEFEAFSGLLVREWERGGVKGDLGSLGWGLGGWVGLQSLTRGEWEGRWRRLGYVEMGVIVLEAEGEMHQEEEQEERYAMSECTIEEIDDEEEARLLNRLRIEYNPHQQKEPTNDDYNNNNTQEPQVLEWDQIVIDSQTQIPNPDPSLQPTHPHANFVTAHVGSPHPHPHPPSEYPTDSINNTIPTLLHARRYIHLSLSSYGPVASSFMQGDAPATADALASKIVQSGSHVLSESIRAAQMGREGGRWVTKNVLGAGVFGDAEAQVDTDGFWSGSVRSNMNGGAKDRKQREGGRVHGNVVHFARKAGVADHEDVAHSSYHPQSPANEFDIEEDTDQQQQQQQQQETEEEGFKPAFYLVVDHPTESVVLCFRGTLSLSDLLLDLTCEYTPLPSTLVPPQSQNPSTLLAHTGFYTAAQKLSDPASTLFKSLQKSLLSNPGYTLVLTGHSLGAGLGCLLGLIWADPLTGLVRPESGLPVETRVRCWGFGTPAILGVCDGVWTDNTPPTRQKEGEKMVVRCSTRPVEGLEKLMTSFVVGADLVPRLSLGSVRDLMASVSFMQRQMNTTTADPNWPSTDEILAEWASSPPQGGVSGDQLEGERRERWEELVQLRDHIQDNLMNNDKLYPPGTVILLEKVLPSQRKVEDMQEYFEDEEKVRTLRGVRVSKVLDVGKVFGAGLDLKSGMLGDHMPQAYMRALHAQFH
ncbi:hypothetical protein HDV05_007343 [Chytridiales sp. JEL 0842]|nr:hypothetical protein HDV05_007343 [Chytridiales sp. JEL 0842]